MENLMSEPARVVKETYQFLGIDDRFLPDDMTIQNEGSYELANNNEMLKWLHNYFQTDNEALFKYLGKRFPWGK